MNSLMSTYYSLNSQQNSKNSLQISKILPIIFVISIFLHASSIFLIHFFRLTAIFSFLYSTPHTPNSLSYAHTYSIYARIPLIPTNLTFLSPPNYYLYIYI